MNKSMTGAMEARGTVATMGDRWESKAAVADEATDGPVAMSELALSSSNSIGSSGSDDSARDNSRNDRGAGSSGTGRRDGNKTSRGNSSNNNNYGNDSGRSNGRK